MKKFILTLIVSVMGIFSSFGMSFSEAQEHAYYLTDKMAYELDLTPEQYDQVYQVNLEYLLNVNASNPFDYYWDYRNTDLSYILFDWQYSMYRAAEYFYRPVVRRHRAWYFPVWDYYHRTYYFYDRPSCWHSWHGGLWHHRTYHTPSPFVGHRPQHHHGGMSGHGGHFDHNNRPGGTGYHGHSPSSRPHNDNHSRPSHNDGARPHNNDHHGTPSHNDGARPNNNNRPSGGGSYNGGGSRGGSNNGNRGGGSYNGGGSRGGSTGSGSRGGYSGPSSRGGSSSSTTPRSSSNSSSRSGSSATPSRGSSSSSTPRSSSSSSSRSSSGSTGGGTRSFGGGGRR